MSTIALSTKPNVPKDRRDEAAKVLAAAFIGDKLWNRLRPKSNERAAKALYWYFRGEVEVAARSGAYVQATYDKEDRINGVLLAYGPGKDPFPWWSLIFRLPAFFLIGPLTSLRMAKLLGKVESKHPTARHVYCWYVGSSALGGGSVLLKRAMKIARVQGVGCYGEAKGEGIAEIGEVLGWSLGEGIPLDDAVEIIPMTWSNEATHVARSKQTEPVPPLRGIPRFAVSYPKLMLAILGVAFVLAGALGAQVTDRLSAGGFVDPSSESFEASKVLEEDFGVGGMQLILAVESSSGAKSPGSSLRANAVLADLQADPRVDRIVSPWTDARPDLVSADGRIGVIAVALRGDDNTAPAAAHEISDRVTGDDGQGVRVTAGGQALTFYEINSQAAKDLTIAEAIAVPIMFIFLIMFLRSVVAAAIPAIIGVVTIVGTSAVLYLLSHVVELSVFALNVTSALGLALAIDYSLLIISRYREELGRGHNQSDAISIAIRHGGRAVIFSGVTVAIALVGTLFFPMAFLRSLAYAGVAVVVLSIVLALICVPLFLTIFGHRINARSLREAQPSEQTLLYRATLLVQRYPVRSAMPVVIILLMVGSPLLGIKVGLPDDRVLSTDSQSHIVGDVLRDNFSVNHSATVFVVLPDAPIDDSAVAGYAKSLSAISGVTNVVSSGGTFTNGVQMGPGDPEMRAVDSEYVAMSTNLDPYSSAAHQLIDAVEAMPSPGHAVVGGLTKQTEDTAGGIADGFVPAVIWIAAVTFLLLLLLSGSVVMPLKALVLNTLSLSATFGALVWVFQDGNLGGFGTDATGYTIATIPVLLFCVAFGLSMDYEVFLLTRFTEEWRKSPQTRLDNDRAVALGIARSGRVVTASAVLMAIAFAGLITSEVAVMRVLGVGLTIAVLLDATIVRAILVPAFMRLAGTWNWWAPKPIKNIAEKAYLRE